MRATAKPLIVGLVHGKKVTDQERVNERARVLGHLGRLPPGSKVGIELSPEQLAWIKTNPAVGIEDTIAFAARNALAKGFEVVPLDTEKRMEKHRMIIGWLRVLMDLLPLARQKPDGASRIIVAEYRKTRRNHVIHTFTRSLGMGLELRRSNPLLNFTCDVHAQQLRPAMAGTHEFEFSMHSPGFASEAEVFSQPENAGSKEKLEALLAKRLSP